MKSKSADAGVETLLMMARLQVMTMPMRGWAWQWAGKPSWEQPDQNKSQKAKSRSNPGDRGSIFKGIEDANKVLSRKPPREQPTKMGITRNLKYQKMGEKTKDVALGREKGSTEPSHTEGLFNHHVSGGSRVCTFLGVCGGVMGSGVASTWLTPFEDMTMASLLLPSKGRLPRLVLPQVGCTMSRDATRATLTT